MLGEENYTGKVFFLKSKKKKNKEDVLGSGMGSALGRQDDIKY